MFQDPKICLTGFQYDSHYHRELGQFQFNL